MAINIYEIVILSMNVIYFCNVIVTWCFFPSTALSMRWRSRWWAYRSTSKRPTSRRPLRRQSRRSCAPPTANKSAFIARPKCGASRPTPRHVNSDTHTRTLCLSQYCRHGLAVRPTNVSHGFFYILFRSLSFAVDSTPDRPYRHQSGSRNSCTDHCKLRPTPRQPLL